MAYSEEVVDRMEKLVPQDAAKAIKAAYEESLRAGNTILIVEDGMLVSVSPNLVRTPLKPVAHRIRIRKGTQFKIK